MSKIMVLLLVVFSVSCAHKDLFQYDSNDVAWVNRSADDLMTHPVFASMPVQTRETDGGLKVYSFKNSGGTYAKGGCVTNAWGFSRCNTAASEVACNHVFTVYQNKVKNYQRVGDCGREELRFRPHVDGKPVLTEGELQRLGSRDIASFEQDKNCGLAGRIFGC